MAFKYVSIYTRPSLYRTFLSGKRGKDVILYVQIQYRSNKLCLRLGQKFAQPATTLVKWPIRDRTWFGFRSPVNPSKAGSTWWTAKRLWAGSTWVYSTSPSTLSERITVKLAWDISPWGKTTDWLSTKMQTLHSYHWFAFLQTKSNSTCRRIYLPVDGTKK